jgi:hypothetical protein
MFKVVFSKTLDFVSCEEFNVLLDDIVFYKAISDNGTYYINVVAPNENIARYKATKIIYR